MLDWIDLPEWVWAILAFLALMVAMIWRDALKPKG
jgi:hypothetical protein